MSDNDVDITVLRVKTPTVDKKNVKFVKLPIFNTITKIDQDL